MFTSCIVGAILCASNGAMHIPGPLAYAPSPGPAWTYATYNTPPYLTTNALVTWPLVTVVRRS
jgi:hypothetical protein